MSWIFWTVEEGTFFEIQYRVGEGEVGCEARSARREVGVEAVRVEQVQIDRLDRTRREGRWVRSIAEIEFGWLE